MRVTHAGIFIFDRGDITIARWGLQRDGEPDSEWPPSPEAAFGAIIDFIAKSAGAKMPAPEPIEPSSEVAVLSWEAIQKANRG